jgi:RHS repeat-associated protein
VILRRAVPPVLRGLLVALAASLLAAPAQAALPSLGDLARASDELQARPSAFSADLPRELPTELPKECNGPLCFEALKTRVGGFDLRLSCHVGGETGLTCTARPAWGLVYGGRAAERSVFTGHIWDEETGLYNAKARYFDPKLGRFLTQDSFLGQIDEPPSLHRYLYANANPTFYIDPTGHYSWSEFKSDARWTKDFIVAAGSDLAQNAPDRVVRTVGATFDQAGNLAVQTTAMGHDTAVLGADAAVRATTGQGFDNVTLYSQLAQSSAHRLGQGEGVGDIVKDSAFEMGANALTVGTYGTFKDQFSTAADYLSGNASIEQIESRLINAAGGAVLNAALGSGGAKVAGEGWMGKAVSVPSPATVVESVSQLSGRARASAQAAWDATSRVLHSDVKLSFDPTVMSMNGLGGVKVRLAPPEGSTSSTFSAGRSHLSSAEMGELMQMPGMKLTNTTGAGAARPPRHHIFTQENRAWFKERGVDIDRYTLELSQGEHSAAHSMGWNKEVQQFIDQEALWGSKYTPREILRFGAQLRREFGLRHHKAVPFAE